jgi:hypothetical protein
VSAPRRLVSLRRRTDPAAGERYDALWSALQGAATAAGARAWRFVAQGDQGLHLEFLEFAEGSDPRALPEVAALLGRLDAEVGGAEVEEWDECRM